VEIQFLVTTYNFDHFSRWNNEYVRNLHTFNIHIYSIMNNKKKVMHWGKYKFKKNKLQKISFKNSFACKSYFWKKNLQSFFKVILLAPSYRFWPKTELRDHFLTSICHLDEMCLKCRRLLNISTPFPFKISICYVC